MNGSCECENTAWVCNELIGDQVCPICKALVIWLN